LFIPDVLVQFITECPETIIGIACAKRKYSSWKQSFAAQWKNFNRKRTIFGIQGLFKVALKLIWRDFLYLLQNKPTSAKKVSRKYDIDFFYLYNVNSKESLSLLRSLNIDLIISMQDQIFKTELINLPRIGCINKHAALLPQFRGVWPIFWAMHNDVEYVGLTIHWINDGIDSGRIINQKSISINKTDTLFTLYKQIFSLCGKSLIEAVKLINNDNNVGTSQPVDVKEYYSFPQKSDVQKFKELGKKVV
jgi:folate-dependent phosphoribosylglycinamide formyltransferase PurN